MKKISVLLIMFLFCSNSYTYGQNYKNNPKQVKKKQNKKEEFDFRKIKWGMTHLQVIASEKSNLLLN